MTYVVNKWNTYVLTIINSLNEANMDKCEICAETKITKKPCTALMNSFSSLVSWSNLHGFNIRLEQHVSWSIKHILDLPRNK